MVVGVRTTFIVKISRYFYPPCDKIKTKKTTTLAEHFQNLIRKIGNRGVGLGYGVIKLQVLTAKIYTNTLRVSYCFI
jgi:tetrahydromethanopterin S-methyltransferase subunit G